VVRVSVRVRVTDIYRVQKKHMNEPCPLFPFAEMGAVTRVRVRVLGLELVRVEIEHREGH
jgi:hypothetical protein